MALIKRCLFTAASVLSLGTVACVAQATQAAPLAAVPPMCWNDWAHYQRNFTAQTLLDHAKAWVSSGLAAPLLARAARCA